MNAITWQAIEDNGGGLHLAVFTGDDCIYIHSGYECNKGQLSDDIAALKRGGHPINDGWDGNADDPQAVYDNITGYEYGWDVVADEIGRYPDNMGRAACLEFGIDE